MKIGFVYYSHNQLPDRLRDVCLNEITRVGEIICADLVAVVAERIDTDQAKKWTQLVCDVNENPVMDISNRVLTGCLASTADYIALIEHDVLYPNDYLVHAPWNLIEDGDFWYDVNTYRVNADGFFPHGGKLMSCCVARRDVLINHFVKRIKFLEAGNKFKWGEPGKDMQGEYPLAYSYQGVTPVLDIRWGGNLTGTRKSQSYQKKINGWMEHCELWNELLGDKLL